MRGDFQTTTKKKERETTKEFSIKFTSSKFPFSFAFYMIFIEDNGICGW